MFKAVSELGVSGGIGILLGIVAVWWVEPATAGGVGLVMVAVLVAVTVIGGIAGRLARKPAGQPTPAADTKPPAPGGANEADGWSG